MEKLKPLFSDKFSVRQQESDSTGTEQPDEAVHQLDPFFHIGIAFFWQKHPDYRDGNLAFLCDGEHEDIDLELTPLPICSVKTESPWAIGRHPPNHDLGNQIRIEIKESEESFQPFVIGLQLDVGAHGCRNSGQTDAPGLDNA